jgi:hypothetical protein
MDVSSLSETALGLCVGVSLAAACGFRVFVPMLVMALGAKAGVISLGEGFEWMSSWAALTGFTVAGALELGAYYVPWLDHALDTVATPAAVIAGTLATASQVDHMHPLLTWATGLIAGGGAAGVTQLATVSTRGISTIASGGSLSPIVTPVMATAQAAIALVLSVLAVVVPIVAGMLLVGVLSVALVLILKHRQGSRERRAFA